MIQAYFVDDEPLVLESFISDPTFLECGVVNIGHSINPFEAVDAILAAQPDVVFTDLIMPGLTGIELISTLRECGYAGEFVIISAHSDYKEVRRFFTMHGFDYLVKPVSEQELQTLLEKLVQKLSARKNVVTTDTQSSELNDIMAYLHSSLAEKHTLESVSNRFHLKPNYICNLFAQHMGTTFVAFLTDIRMKAAAEMLVTSSKSLREIAASCGFKDYFYFCNVFRRAFSCTPSAYRKAQ